MILPTFHTDATDALCREVAEKSNGTCYLMFSGGKDSVCAWLQLRRWFKRIVPFHCASIPHLAFKDAYLDYLEYEFQTKILRLMGEDLKMALARHVYQETITECQKIDRLIRPVEDYDKLTILNYLRYKFNLPRAWCAVGISASDSIDRRIYCNQTGGKSEDHRTFYPCWDWPRSEIVKAIRESGLKLSSEYRYSKRSIGGVPSATYNAILAEHYPADYAKVKFFYPMCDIKNYRKMLLDSVIRDAADEAVMERGGKVDDEEVEEKVEGEGSVETEVVKDEGNEAVKEETVGFEEEVAEEMGDEIDDVAEEDEGGESIDPIHKDSGKEVK